MGLPEAILIAVFVGSVTVFHTAWVLTRRSDPVEPEPHRSDTNESPGFDESWVIDIERQLSDLTVAVSNGIAHVNRHEKRVQKTVTSARRLLRENGLEHAGLEAEDAEIRERDDAPVQEPGVLPLPELMEADIPASQPSWQLRNLRKVGG